MLWWNDLLKWNLELCLVDHYMTYWIHSISQNVCWLKSHSTGTWRTVLMSSFHSWFKSPSVLFLSWVLNQRLNHRCTVLSKLAYRRTNWSWAKIISLPSFIHIYIFSFNELWYFLISKDTAIRLFILQMIPKLNRNEQLLTVFTLKSEAIINHLLSHF